MTDQEIPDKLFFRIGEAAELVEVEPHVLRYWETEFKLRPQRSDSGQRLYRRNDIEQFLRIKRLLHEDGFTIAGARKAIARPTEAPLVGGASLRDVVDRLQALRNRIATTRGRFSEPR